MKAVAFSPHTDDVVFSIGAHLPGIEGEVVIATPFAAVPDDPVGRTKHSTLRQEHKAACQIEGANEINGPFLDDVYPAPSRADVSAWLHQQLQESDVAYIPLGIHHPDHLLTSNLLLDLIRIHPGVVSKVYFYAELPYKIDYPMRHDVRLAHVENCIGRLREIYSVGDDERKERAVRAYASQVDESVLAKVFTRESIWELVR